MEKTTVKISALKQVLHELADSGKSHIDYIDNPENSTKDPGKFHRKTIIKYFKAAIALLE